jgi:HEAT repeat protein
VALGNIAVALQHAKAINSIEQLKTAYEALKLSSEPDIKGQAEVVKKAIDSLELIKSKSFIQILLEQVREHPFIGAFIALEIILLIIWLILLGLYPLSILRINERLKFDIKVSNKPLEVTLPVRYIITVGFFNYHTRVLDAWVTKYISSAREQFARKATVEEREVFVPIPVIHDKETIAHLTAQHLRPVFNKNRSCLLIWGEGGAGKTSLTCQIGKWAMLDDKAERLCEHHTMLPILVEQDLNFQAQGSRRPLLEAIRGQLTDLIDAAEPISEQFLIHLLRQRRVLVIIDGLSELNEATQEEIRPGNPEFPVNALIITSRINEQLDKVAKSTVRPLRIQGDRLSSFMEAYLIQRDKRDLFNDPEYFDACRRLSLIVGDRDITVLLAKLYAEQMIASKEEAVDEGWPENIPDLMLYYLNDLNRGAGDDRPDNRTIHYIAKTIAWECLRHNYRPTPARRDEILYALSGEQESEQLIRYLEVHLKILQTVGPAQDCIRFALDPLAEYLAGLHLVDRYGAKEDRWREFLAEADGMPNAPEGIKGFLLAIRDCCLAKTDEAKLPEFLPDELAKRAGLDPEVINQIHLEHRIHRLITNLELPDPDDKLLAAQALKKIGPQAKIAVPSLIRVFKNEKNVEVREKVIESLTSVSQDAKLLIPLLVDALSDQEAAVRSSAIIGLARFGVEAQIAVPKLVELLNDGNEAIHQAAVKALKVIGAQNEEVRAILELKPENSTS